MATPTGDLVAPVEDSMFACWGSLSCRLFDLRDEPDVQWFTSPVDTPLLNGAMRARFAADTVERRTNEVLDALCSHGHAFMWTLTPTTRSPRLEEVLAERGLQPDGSMPGMHVDLDAVEAFDEPVPPPLRLGLTTAATLRPTVEAMVAGFGMAAELAAPLAEVFAAAPGSGDGTMRHVYAQAPDGTMVGGGTVVVAGGMAGLYNIAVVEAQRGRGIGRAITLGLMRVARTQGCSSAVLHASALGRPVYERIGFRQVCRVDQWMWRPSGA